MSSHPDPTPTCEISPVFSLDVSPHSNKDEKKERKGKRKNEMLELAASLFCSVCSLCCFILIFVCLFLFFLFLFDRLLFPFHLPRRAFHPRSRTLCSGDGGCRSQWRASSGARGQGGAAVAAARARVAVPARPLVLQVWYDGVSLLCMLHAKPLFGWRARVQLI
jgi:hypothetical protein